MFCIALFVVRFYNRSRDEEEVDAKEICREIANKYEIIRILGQGQSGIVYLAKHKQLQVFRAIKVVPRESRFYECIKNEAELLKELRHPGIPMIYDFVEQDSDLYLIEEYIEGENLYEYIRRHGRFCERSMAKLALDLIEPLEYLHGRQIVHLDLSPNNIVISQNRAGIIDFDHSAFMHEENNGYGSLGFASKKQMLGHRVHADMDIFAIGAVLYYTAVCEKYKGEIRKLPAGIGEIRDVIRRCLAEEESEKFHSLSELKTEFMRIAAAKRRNKVALVGAKAGLGVTFLSLCLAGEMQKQKKEVCVFERNTSGDMAELAKRTGKKCIDGFVFQKSRIFPFTGPYIEAAYSDADWEILDCKDDWERAVSENPDVLVLVCSAKLWNAKYNLTAIRQIVSTLKFRKTLLAVYNCWDKKDKILLPDTVKAESVICIPPLSATENNRTLTDLARLILNVEEVRFYGY